MNFFTHLEQMSDDDARASIQRAERLTAKCASEVGDINENGRNEMAYSDYGAFVYKNGIRRTDKEDAPAFNLSKETFAVDFSAAELALWKITNPEKYDKIFNHSDHMYHGVCGDDSIRVACYKQGLPQIFEATNDIIEKISYYNPCEIDRYYFKPFDFKYKGYCFHFEPDDPYDSNSPYIVEMTEPNGTHWHCEYDYEYGAGFEDE